MSSSCPPSCENAENPKFTSKIKSPDFAMKLKRLNKYFDTTIFEKGAKIVFYTDCNYVMSHFGLPHWTKQNLLRH